MPKLLFFYFAGIAVITESCAPNSQQLCESVQLIIHHAGKYADFVLLDENPLVDIHATQRIHGVVLREKLLGPPKSGRITVISSGKVGWKIRN